MTPTPPTGWRRYRAQLVVLVVGLLAVLGVRALVQDDDGDDGDARRPTTTEVERDGDESTTTTRGGSAPDDEEDEDDADVDLGSVALRLDDLPGDWAAAEAAPLELCPDADPAEAVPPSDSYQVAYSGGPTGPFVGNVVAELQSAGRAEDFLDAAESSIDDCATYELDGDRVEVERIDADEVGDEVVAARVSGGGQLPTRGTVHYVRVGRHVVTVVLVAVGDNPPAGVAQAALEAVVGRLEAAGAQGSR